MWWWRRGLGCWRVVAAVIVLWDLKLQILGVPLPLHLTAGATLLLDGGEAGRCKRTRQTHGQRNTSECVVTLYTSALHYTTLNKMERKQQHCVFWSFTRPPSSKKIRSLFIILFHMVRRVLHIDFEGNIGQFVLAQNCCQRVGKTCCSGRAKEDTLLLRCCPVWMRATALYAANSQMLLFTCSHKLHLHGKSGPSSACSCKQHLHRTSSPKVCPH